MKSDQIINRLKIKKLKFLTVGETEKCRMKLVVVL